MSGTRVAVPAYRSLLTAYFSVVDSLPPLATIPPNVPRRGGPVRRGIGRLVLRLLGWRMTGSLPDVPKFVIIAAPHTSNRDFILGMSLVFAQSLDAKWIGKHSLFRAPLGPFFRWLGGIPVDRGSPQGVVGDIVAAFQSRDRMILAIAPEGTRRAVTRWKTGFHRIARDAGVPIVRGFFDNRRKVVGFGPVLEPTDDMEGDIARLQAWYAPLVTRVVAETEQNPKNLPH